MNKDIPNSEGSGEEKKDNAPGMLEALKSEGRRIVKGELPDPRVVGSHIDLAAGGDEYAERLKREANALMEGKTVKIVKGSEIYSSESFVEHCNSMARIADTAAVNLKKEGFDVGCLDKLSSIYRQAAKNEGPGLRQKAQEKVGEIKDKLLRRK